MNNVSREYHFIMSDNKFLLMIGGHDLHLYGTIAALYL